MTTEKFLIGPGSAGLAALVQLLLSEEGSEVPPELGRDGLKQGVFVTIVLRVSDEPREQLARDRADGHLRQLDVFGERMNRAEFCELAVRCGYGWYKAGRVWDHLVAVADQLGIGPVQYEPCSRFAKQKCLQRRARGDHDRPAEEVRRHATISIGALLVLDPAEVNYHSTWPPIVRAVQRLLRDLYETAAREAGLPPMCFTCGTRMRPAGSCFVCEGCGSTSAERGDST